MLKDSIGLDPAGVDQVAQVVAGSLVGSVRVELNDREVERFRAIQGRTLEHVVHGVHGIIDGPAPDLLAVWVVIAKVRDVDMDRDRIGLVTNAADGVHQAGHIGQLLVVVVALVEESPDLVHQIVGVAHPRGVQRLDAINTMAIPVQSEPQISE